MDKLCPFRTTITKELNTYSTYFLPCLEETCACYNKCFKECGLINK